MKQQSFAIWLTGLPSSGKSTVCRRLVSGLGVRGIDIAVLESDVLRRTLGAEGAYDDAGRERFYRSVVWIGALLTEHGVPVIFDATANRRVYREWGRGRIPRFMEVWIDTPLEVCMARDPKGIYRRGQEDPLGKVPGLQTGYEPPVAPEVRIDGRDLDADQAARDILAKMVAMGFIA